MTPDILDLIRDLPFKTRALVEKITDPGTVERELGNCVYDSQKRTVEYILKAIDERT